MNGSEDQTPSSMVGLNIGHTTITKVPYRSRALLICPYITLVVIHSQVKLQFCFSCVLLATFFAVDQVAHMFRFASHRLLDIVDFAIVGAGT